MYWIGEKLSNASKNWAWGKSEVYPKQFFEKIFEKDFPLNPFENLAWGKSEVYP
jgi:hypothetical protein